MAEQTQTMPDYIGTVLTNGAFLKMHQSYRDLIEKSNPANMKCDALLATYKAALKKMTLFVGSEQGFIETADLQVLDQKRDSMWLALYYYVHYLAQLPVDNALSAPARRLNTVIAPFKGLARHEMTKQTAETQKLIDLLTKADNQAALEELGLKKLYEEMKMISYLMVTTFTQREAERGRRIDAKGGETAADVRRQIGDTYREMAIRINASLIFLEGSMVKQLIQDANGVAEHYRHVAAQMQARKDEDKPTGETTTVNPEDIPVEDRP